MAGAAVVAFVALLIYGVTTKSPDTTIDDSLAEGQATPAPGFELAVLDRGRPGPRLDQVLANAARDGSIALEELRGTAVVLNFWASWCVPCREEAPRMQGTWQDARTRGVLFLGLNMQDLTDDARDFLRAFSIDYPSIRDPSNGTARAWGVAGLPETFFVSASGQVVGHVIGVVSVAQLRDGVAAAASGRPRAAREGGARRPTR